MAILPFRTAYDKLNKEVSQKTSISFLDEDGNIPSGRTKQDCKEECDINYVLKKYDKTGLLLHVNKAKAQYGDYTTVNEYQVNLNKVMEAQASFDDLPSSVRKRFQNDPGEFLEYISNPKNDKEMIELGLAIPRPTDDPIKVVVTNPPTTKKPPETDVNWPLKTSKDD